LHSDQQTTLALFRLVDMMPKDLNSYYSYHGSLTTPPCKEEVHWIVFNQTVELSANQVC